MLFYFPMQGVASEVRIIFFLFQPARGIEAFFIASGDITGDRFTLGSGLGALEDNDVSGHNYSFIPCCPMPVLLPRRRRPLRQSVQTKR
jgi:hypothetical protein